MEDVNWRDMKRLTPGLVQDGLQLLSSLFVYVPYIIFKSTVKT